jgi:hypothetical protein
VGGFDKRREDRRAKARLRPAHGRARYTNAKGNDKLIKNYEDTEEIHLSEHKPEETFRVIDRRPFTAEGEVRKEFVEQEEREAARAAAAPPAPAAEVKAAVPAKETPKALPAFENLVRMLGSNAAMVLGAYTDPRTGQPMLDPDAARDLIDMLDALREKTLGNLAPEEDSMLLDLLGKLKMTFLEITQAMQAAQAKAKGRG